MKYKKFFLFFVGGGGGGEEEFGGGGRGFRFPEIQEKISFEKI